MDEQALKMMGQIDLAVERLRTTVQRASGADQEVREKLTMIWTVTQELERRLARPEVIVGLRAEAVRQIEQVYMLISETTACQFDERQLISIGFACELAVDGIKNYLNSARIASRKAVSEAVMEG